jgi:membrane protease subunit HflC
MKRLTTIVVAVLLAWWASTAAFQVDETEYAVVTQFGRPVRSILDAGLQFKWPVPIQWVLRFDRRVQVFETPAAGRPSDEFLTRDKKNVVVGTYTVWRIGRSEAALSRFLQSVRDVERAEVRLADLVVSELGAALGQNPFSALITKDAAEWKWPQLVSDIGRRCRETALRDYGVEIVDFQVQRLSFPEQNRRSVFERMRAERERIASQYRSEGDAEARKIRSEAELEANRIRAEAEEQHLKIVGAADAEATRIYGEAYGQDPEFYKFVRALETYATALDENTVAIFSAANEFLKPLIQIEAQRPPAGATEPSASQPTPPTADPHAGAHDAATK